MQKNYFTLCAVASAAAMLVGCGGGGTDVVGGGTAITPGVTIAVEQAPPAQVSFTGGDMVNLSSVMGAYKSNLTAMSWSAVPATAGAPDLAMSNANCTSAKKNDVKGATGFSSSVWECATSAPAPILSQPVSYRVTVTGTDTAGLSASASSLVTINPPGAAAQEALKPLVALPLSVEVVGGSTAAITCNASPGPASVSKAITYAWRVKSNPNAVALNLSSTDKSTVQFTAPSLSAGKSTSVILECVATDVSGASTASEVKVNLISAAESSGLLTAQSTERVNMYSGVESQLSCFGSGGYTTDTKGLTYQWVIKSNPSGVLLNLTGDNSATVRVKPGTLTSTNNFEVAVLQCRVTDVANKTGTVDVAIQINRPQTVSVPSPIALANAGLSQSVNAGQIVALSGTGTRVSGDTPAQLYYAWSQVGGPSVSLSGANTATPSFKAPVVTSPTTLRFMLTASTQALAAGYVPKTGEVSFVDIYVGATTVPVITLPTVAEVAPGSASTITAALQSNPDNKPVYYRWSQISGANVVMQTPNAASVSFFAPPTEGDLLFRVQASFDPAFSESSIASADAVLRVKASGSGAAQNTVLANAGASQNVTAGQVVNLNGAGTTSSGANAGQIYYAWTQVSGTAVSLSGANTATPSFRAPVVSTTTALRFMLTASNQVITAGYAPKPGEVSFVDVFVAASAPPQITLPNVTEAAPGTPTAITVSMSGNPENLPVYYRWTQVSGTSVVIQSPNSATMSFYAPNVDGDLVFRVEASFSSTFANSSTADALFRVKTPAAAAPAV